MPIRMPKILLVAAIAACLGFGLSSLHSHSASVDGPAAEATCAVCLTAKTSDAPALSPHCASLLASTCTRTHNAVTTVAATSRDVHSDGARAPPQG
jgi:hypothetical protein